MIQNYCESSDNEYVPVGFDVLVNKDIFYKYFEEFNNYSDLWVYVQSIKHLLIGNCIDKIFISPEQIDLCAESSTKISQNDLGQAKIPYSFADCHIILDIFINKDELVKQFYKKDKRL